MAYTTINKSTEHFNARPYVGNGGTLNITGMEFQPDLTWLKCRDIAYYHRLYDVIRGPLKSIRSDTSAVEETRTGEGLTAFNSNGYTVIQGSNTEYNNNNVKYASWNWKANSTGSANTDGSISSTVSVNTTGGFSICKWTGSGANATIGHGLGAVPKMIIVKNISTTDSWMVYHVGSGSNAYLHLETTNAALSPSTAQFQATTPTSSFFYVGTANGTNKSSSNMIAYCFAEKQGYSKFGNYTGNGNANGTFVYLGFKPAFIMIKRTDNTADWELYDSKRLGYNSSNPTLYPNTTSIEGGIGRIDILSNGFKIVTTSGNLGASGGTYIYMAFGQSIVGSNNVPNNAR